MAAETPNHLDQEPEPRGLRTPQRVSILPRMVAATAIAFAGGTAVAETVNAADHTDQIFASRQISPLEYDINASTAFPETITSQHPASENEKLPRWQPFLFLGFACLGVAAVTFLLGVNMYEYRRNRKNERNRMASRKKSKSSF